MPPGSRRAARLTQPPSLDTRLQAAFAAELASTGATPPSLVRALLLAAAERLGGELKAGVALFVSSQSACAEPAHTLGAELAELVENTDVASLIGALAFAWDALQSLGGAQGAATERQKRGAFYTPRPLIDRVLTFADPDGAARTVCDPACGTGAFLAAYVERAIAAGRPAHDVVPREVYGADIDATAVLLARSSLFARFGGGLPAAQALCAHLVAGDALAGPVLAGTADPGAIAWWSTFAQVFARSGFDAVVGNPPFQNQLELATTRTDAARRNLETLHGAAARGLVDSAALFASRATELVRPGGRVALVLPRSVLNTRDARPVRDRLATDCVLEHLYVGGGREFESAAVQVIAAGWRRATSPRWTVARSGPAGALPPLVVAAAELREAPAWAALVADLDGVPAVELVSTATLATIARPSGDFHNIYYGLRGAFVDRREADSAAFAPAITTGLVDPFRNDWGTQTARFDKQARLHPRLDLALLAADPQMARWSVERRVPKVVVGSIGRVIEAWADVDGSALPVPPLVSVACPAEHLWATLAVLQAPAVSAWYARRFGSGSFGKETFRVSAPNLAEIPLPADRAAWERGAALARELSEKGAKAELLAEFGRAMNDAYGVSGDALLPWWLERVG